METEKEIKQFKENLNKVKLKTISFKWRIGLLILIMLLIVGGYFI